MSLMDCCRLCLKNLADVLQDDDDHYTIPGNHELQRMIFDCFQILVTDDEIIPRVCSRCNEQALVVDKIRKRVEAVDFEIKQYYSSLVDVLIEEEPDQSPTIMVEEIDIIDQKPDDFMCNEIVEETCDDNLIEQYEFIEMEPTIDIDQESAERSPSELPSENEQLYVEQLKKVKKTTPKRVGRKADSKCYICETVFDTIEEFDDHISSHIGSTGQECHLCQEPVSTVRFLNAHLRRVHFRKSKPIPCKECRNNNIDREFPSHFKLYAHMREEHNRPAEVKEKKFICTYCGKSFNRGTALRLHENIHTKAILYNCKRCPFKTTAKSALFRHERVHTAEKPFKCDECSASFGQSNGLHYHKFAKHSAERPFSCKICGNEKRFKSKYTLQTHMLTHQKPPPKQDRRTQVTAMGTEIVVCERKLKCDFCPAVYSYEKFLCRHIVEKHPEKKVPMLSCELCKKENKKKFFLTQKEKDKHIEYHRKGTAVPKKERVCPDCGEVYQTTESFHRHRQIHIKHDCKDCGKSFATTRALRLHVESVHLKLRPYKCDKCDSAFAQFTSLTSHMKRHERIV